MAEALFAHRLSELGLPATVRSAGMLPGGAPPPSEVITTMAGYGLNVSSHRSQTMTPEILQDADLILAMARESLRHAVVTAPQIWPRAFTLRELARRGEAIGPRSPGESLADWLARAHEGRERAALLGDSPDDDVADPVGGPQHAYTETAAILSDLLDQLVYLCWPD